jgi:hypothetical protein
MLFVHAPEDGWAELDETQIAEGLAARAAVIERLRKSGHLIACSPLTAPEEGREVRVRGGNVEVSALNSEDEPIAGFTSSKQRTAQRRSSWPQWCRTVSTRT